MGTRLVVLEWDYCDMGIGLWWYWNVTAMTWIVIVLECDCCVTLK